MRGNRAQKALYGHRPLTGVTKNDPYVSPDHPRPSQTVPDRPRPSQTRPDRPRPDHPRPSQTRGEPPSKKQTVPDQGNLSQKNRPSHTRGNVSQKSPIGRIRARQQTPPPRLRSERSNGASAPRHPRQRDFCRKSKQRGRPTRTK